MGLNFTEDWYREYQRRQGKRPVSAPKPEPDKPKRSKYGNRKTECDGTVFDSQHEANAYREIQLRIASGELRAVACQVRFLLPGGVTYIADFVVMNCDGTFTVMDAKSEATQKDKVYRLKRRMMKNCLGIEIVEV